jgi:hypothetical protein
MPMIRADDPAERAHQAARARTALPAPSPRTGQGGRAYAGMAASADAGGVSAARLLEGCVRTEDFLMAPVDPDTVANLVHEALGAQERHWPSEVHGDAGFAVHLAASDVRDLARGLYAAEDGSWFRVPHAEGLAGEVPRVYGDAPAHLLISADFDKLAERPAAYAALISRAGSVAQGIWFSALTRGLACAVHDRPARAITSFIRGDGNRRHLLTVSVGTSCG